MHPSSLCFCQNIYIYFYNVLLIPSQSPNRLQLTHLDWSGSRLQKNLDITLKVPGTWLTRTFIQILFTENICNPNPMWLFSYWHWSWVIGLKKFWLWLWQYIYMFLQTVTPEKLLFGPSTIKSQLFLNSNLIIIIITTIINSGSFFPFSFLLNFHNKMTSISNIYISIYSLVAFMALDEFSLAGLTVVMIAGLWSR